MPFPHFSFQNSVLFIDQQDQYENLIRGGLLSYPVHFEFCENSNSGDAIKRIESSKPDLIVSSMEFKDGSFLDFAHKIHNEMSKIPAIYITEDHLHEVQNKVLKMGIFDLVTRDAAVSELIRKMNHAVMASKVFRKSRSESFIEMHEKSKEQGVAMASMFDSMLEQLHKN